MSSGPAHNSEITRRDITSRSITTRQETLDTTARSVEATIATQNVTRVLDLSTFEIIDEVLIVRGMELPETVALLDNHFRFSLGGVLGSGRGFRRQSEQIVGRLFFAEGPEDSQEERAWRLVSQGHQKAVSAGYAIREATIIPAGETATVGSRQFTAGELDLRIVTRSMLREVSLTPVQADPNANIRRAITGPRTRPQRLSETLNVLVTRKVTDRYRFPQIRRDLAEASRADVDALLRGAPARADREGLRRMAAVLDCESDTLISAAEADGFSL